MQLIYKKGKFLAGDAAHIHSPAEGQGMNTGIQDAFNLAWKLALVIKGKSNSSLLDSYHDERYPTVNDIVTKTNHLTNMFLFDKSFFCKLRKCSDEISNNPHLSKKFGEELTQLNIQYKNSLIINYKESPNERSPQQGERAPNVTLNDSKTLYSYLHNTHHTILVFTGNKLEKNNLTQIKVLESLLNNKFSDCVRMFIITNENPHPIDNIIYDAENAVHQHYKVEQFSTYIIRPDNYIGYYSNGIDLSSIEDFLQQVLLTKTELRSH